MDKTVIAERKRVAPEFIEKLNVANQSYPMVWVHGSSSPQAFNQREQYRQRIQQIDQEFKIALLTSFGVLNHPGVDMAYQYAWENGHSNGYSEVENIFSDLYDIFQAMLEA